MIIDFHTHTFPAEIADRAVTKLANSSNMKNYLSGKESDLKLSMEEAHVDYSVLLPVVTKPSQQEHVNKAAIEHNEHFQETGIISFGGIHPDNSDYRVILRSLAQNGIRGIKIHPVFQETYIDDIRFLRILECACENDLIVLTHAGFDISFPGQDYVSPKHILSAIEQVKPDKLVLAHMGGWNCWDEVEELLTSQNVWFDTSFSFYPIRPMNEAIPYVWKPQLTMEQFKRIVLSHGTDHILYGSDSPWTSQAENIAMLKECGFDEATLSAILGGNAKELLKL